MEGGRGSRAPLRRGDARHSLQSTALLTAVFTFDPDTAIVRRLLDAGASHNVVDRTGTTPLLRAAIAKDTAVFRVLAAKGADPCSKDGNEKTVLDYAGPEFPVLRRMATAAFQRCQTASR